MEKKHCSPKRVHAINEGIYDSHN